jgi:hypothetical protein
MTDEPDAPPPAPDAPPPAPDAPPPAPPRLSRGRRYAVRALLVVGTILLIVSIFAVWANRQVLDSDNWADTSSALLEDPHIRTQLSAFLVDQVYANVDVTSEVASALPRRLKPLAGPAANGLQELAERRMNRLLDRPRIQQAWEEANRTTAQQFINIAEGKSGAITTSGNAVILDLRTLVATLAQRLGIPRSLVDKIPPTAGRIKIMSSDQIGTVQNGASALKGLAIVLPLVALGMLALAVYLSKGRRRRVLLFAGIDLVVAGAAVLVARNLIGNSVVESLVKTDGIKPAAHAAWSIGTGMLKEVGQATIIIGIPAIIAAWLAGPTRPAVAFRRTAAPWLRDRPVATYSVVAVLVALVIAWGPIPATRMVLPVLIMIALVIVGVEALRRQTAEEFPDATADGTRASMQAAAGRAQRAVLGSRRTTIDAGPAGEGDGRLAQLERLTALHDKGTLTDEEFAAEKASILDPKVA